MARFSASASASALTGIRVLDEPDLDAVLDGLPAAGTFEVRPVG